MPRVRFESCLKADDFIFKVEDAPGAADQTVLLFHRFSHGCECEAVGPFDVSEQWASIDRAGAELCAGCKTGEESGNTLTADLDQTLTKAGLECPARLAVEKSAENHGLASFASLIRSIRAGFLDHGRVKPLWWQDDSSEDQTANFYTSPRPLVSDLGHDRFDIFGTRNGTSSESVHSGD